jgi:S1-C subfamily serine protease
MRRIIVATAVLAVAAAGCTVDIGGREGGDAVDTLRAPAAGREPVAAVVQQVLPSVVNVTTDVFTTDPLGNGQEGQGVGTGFVVDESGVVVTNCHVIEGASRIVVSTSDERPDRYDARVIGGDCQNDVAVLQLDGDGLPAIPLGDSDDLALGQSVVALGYALALEGGPTVTQGIISSLDRTVRAQDPNCSPEVCEDGVRVYANVMQTDAAINRGNSGGPLVDLQGRVVGINSAGAAGGAQNIGFSIPIDAAKETIRQAIEEPLEPAAYLGVTTQPVTPTLAYQLDLPVESGAFVLATATGAPAAEAGIEQGDVIVAVDGNEVAGPEDLGAVLEGRAPGDRASVELVNGDGERRTVEVTLGTRPLPVELP